MNISWLLIISLYFINGLSAQVPVAYLEKKIANIDSVFLNAADSLFNDEKKGDVLMYSLYSVLEISCPLHRADSNIFNVRYSYFRYSKENDSLYYWKMVFPWNIREKFILPQKDDEISVGIGEVYVIKTGLKRNKKFWTANDYLSKVLVEKFRTSFYDGGPVGVQWWLRREVIRRPQSKEHIAIKTRYGDFTEMDIKQLKNWEQILSYW